MSRRTDTISATAVIDRPSNQNKAGNSAMWRGGRRSGAIKMDRRHGRCNEGVFLKLKRGAFMRGVKWIMAMAVGIVLAGGDVGWAQLGDATEPTDAAAIYMQAAKIVRSDDARDIMAPAASNMTYQGYPPMSDEWLRMEKEDYDAHGQVRKLVHQAASMTHAAWPPFDRQRRDSQQMSYLNECRNLANEIGDAALYESLILKGQPAAFESVGDVMRLAELLKNQPGEILVRLLVADGIEALGTNRLLVMVSGVQITEDAGDRRDLQLAMATAWIARLLDHPDAQADLDQAIKGEGEPAWAAINPFVKPSLDRALETGRRVQSEKDMVAMSLAAHVYQHKHGRWPQNMEELRTELARVPIDPWGDGKQTLGYVLVKGGLPDGSDRPLIYLRFHSQNGLFYRVDRPEYGFYNGLVTNLPGEEPKRGGQFRDVARWAPGANAAEGPTTRAMQ
jgi:hypothetical protein